jgi:hypothetical protein
MSNYQGRNFGFTPPMVNEQQVAQKKALPAQLIPPDAVHTGDGWTFQPLPDGTVNVRVINPIDGNVVASTLLTSEEFDAVLRTVRPMKDEKPADDKVLGNLEPVVTLSNGATLYGSPDTAEIKATYNVAATKTEG